MSFEFPETKFGKCPRCGRGGLDDGSATGSGYELFHYMGEYLCRFCIIELEDRETDDDRLIRHSEEDGFRESAGFTKK